MSAVASALSQGAGRATLARHAAPRNTTSHAAAHRTRLAVTASAVPPATPKLAVITGANTGLGRASAEDFLKQGYKVVMACRSLERAEAAAAEMKRSMYGENPQLDIIQLDLASLNSVSDFVSTFNAKYDRCDVLLNNAGVMAPPNRLKTSDGFELQIGTNHLGHFALTAGLLPSLAAAPDARIVNVSSVAHEFGKMDFENLQGEGLFGYWGLGWPAYGQSKLANLHFTYELHRQLRVAGLLHVSTNAVHPGIVDTELPRFLPANFYPLMKQTGILISSKQGAQGQIALCTDPVLAATSGKYWADLASEGKAGTHQQRRSSAASYNLEDSAKLWQVSQELTGASFDFAKVAGVIAAEELKTFKVTAAPIEPPVELVIPVVLDPRTK